MVSLVRSSAARSSRSPRRRSQRSARSRTRRATSLTSSFEGGGASWKRTPRPVRVTGTYARRAWHVCLAHGSEIDAGALTPYGREATPSGLALATP